MPTFACSSVDPLATDIPAILDPVFDHYRRASCATTAEGVAFCPFLCRSSDDAPEAYSGCSSTDITGLIFITSKSPLVCVPCLPPCPPPTNTTAGNTTARCTTVDPLATQTPAIFVPELGESLRDSCAVTPEDVAACPYLCGPYKTRGCSPVDLSGLVVNNGSSPLVCEHCLPPCSVGNITVSIPSSAPTTLLNINATTTCTTIDSSATPVPALWDPDPSFPAFVRSTCGITAADVGTCPFICGNSESFQPGSPGGCSSVDLTGQNSLVCEQCLPPCSSSNVSLSLPGNASSFAAQLCPSALLLGQPSNCTFVCGNADASFAPVCYPDTTTISELYSNSSLFCIECGSCLQCGLRAKLAKRQVDLTNSTNSTVPSSQPPFALTGQGEALVNQLASAILIVEILYSGTGDLAGVCDAFSDVTVITDLFLQGLNGSLIQQRICAAVQRPPTTNVSAVAQIVGLAAALYAVEVAANFSGTTDPRVLCYVIDWELVSSLGFDGQAAQDYICAAGAGSSLPPTPTGSSLAWAPLPPPTATGPAGSSGNVLVGAVRPSTSPTSPTRVNAEKTHKCPPKYTYDPFEPTMTRYRPRMYEF